MTTVDYANLSTNVASLDQALYVASCMAGAWAGGIAHIYGTTDPEAADETTGERYLIIADDNRARFYLTHGFALAYTITRPPRD